MSETFPFFDAHAHIDSKSFDEDRLEVIQRAEEAGVTHIVCIGAADEMKANYTSVKLAEEHANIYATVGVHPHDARIVDEDCLVEIERLAQGPKVVAIGETGLDYHYDHSPRDKQREVFRQFLQMAKNLDLPAVIHTRDADEDTIEILKSENTNGLCGVLHSFTGGRALAETAIDIGWYVSFSGILTFNSAQNLRDIAADLPPEQVLVETDAPYLAPVPKRGRRNEPSYVVHTVDKLAELWKMDPIEVRKLTGANAASFYGIET